ncbi:MAG: hypothetical protein R2684_15335 [Pyrinomonadaceae bacterium]
MKKIIIALAAAAILGVFGSTVMAQQCDKTRMSPIRCGFYEEGYQDGANDARQNSDNDYKRYRSKYDSQYESFYQSGYDDGYASVRPFSRWNDRQKNSYDQGYDDGKDDRERNISRLPARYEGQYDKTYEEYYRKGYFDGYDNRPETYDTPIGTGGGPIVPGTGTGRFPRVNNRRGTMTGTATWSANVDDRVNIIIKGNEMTTERVSGTLTNNVQNLQGVLPRRDARISVNKLEGRGSVFVLQQPSRSNDYTAKIQVYDPRRGRDDYRIQISWTATNTTEAYSAGKVTWRGRVDQTVSIKIYGEEVESIDEAGTGLSNVSHNLTGYLAARPGVVRVTKRNGRGSVYVLEQPSEQNDYTAVIRVFDERGGDDDYEIDIEW